MRYIGLGKKYTEPQEKPIWGALTVYRERGNFLQRRDLYKLAIQAYDEALRWHNTDVRTLLARSQAKCKSTFFYGALADAALAKELEPDNLKVQQVYVETEYQKCEFERALMLSHRGAQIRKLPTNFSECVKHSECTITDCIGDCARKTLNLSQKLLKSGKLKDVPFREDLDHYNTPRKSRIKPETTSKVQEVSQTEAYKKYLTERFMASKYLDRMAHDKYFLINLVKDERIKSANKKGSKELEELAKKALCDLEKRQAVLRERRPIYSMRASEEAAKARLKEARKQKLNHQQAQYIKDAKRVLKATVVMYEKRDTAKCLENVEFAMSQISRIPASLLPGKDKFMNELYNIVANTFLDQKIVSRPASEAEREQRAFILLGLAVSREPSLDSILPVRPMAPPRDSKQRLRRLERNLGLTTRVVEKCYTLHELSRLYIDMRQAQRGMYFASKLLSESRSSGHKVWILNAIFLQARCQIMLNNRSEAKAALLEGSQLARMYKMNNIANFYETCANVSTEGEVMNAVTCTVDQREKEMVNLMQDQEMRSEAQNLFRRMSVLPAARRFSVMPTGQSGSENAQPVAPSRRQSIMPRGQQPVQVQRKTKQVVGFQDFDA